MIELFFSKVTCIQFKENNSAHEYIYFDIGDDGSWNDFLGFQKNIHPVYLGAGFYSDLLVI